MFDLKDLHKIEATLAAMDAKLDALAKAAGVAGPPPVATTPAPSKPKNPLSEQ
jgi:hypothetical protein